MATGDANLANCVSMVCRTWVLVERALDEELSYEALCQKNVRIPGCVCQLMITLALLLTLDTAAPPLVGSPGLYVMIVRLNVHHHYNSNL